MTDWESNHELKKILDELNENQARVIVCRKLQNKTICQTAQVIGLSPSRTGQIQRQAIERLREPEMRMRLLDAYPEAHEWFSSMGLKW